MDDKKTNTNNGTIRMLKGTFCCVIITAILDKILSNPLEYLWELISSKKLWLTDLLYKRMAEGFLVNIPFYIFLVLAIFASMYFSKNEKQKEPEREDGRCNDTCKKDCKKCFKYGLRICKDSVGLSLDKAPNWITFLLIWLVTIVFLSVTNFVNHTMMKTINNIEIVAESVDDAQYKQMKSSFYQMKNYDDYKKLTDEIQETAEKNCITLQN